MTDIFTVCNCKEAIFRVNVKQMVPLTGSEPVSWSVNQSIDQSIIQSINQSVRCYVTFLSFSYSTVKILGVGDVSRCS